MNLKITKKIKNLEIDELKENLFHYVYDNRTLKTLVKNNVSKDNVSYITAYSSFVGEIYENTIYELLLDYAKNNQDIKSFVLKGPYQKMENKFIKSGLLIDRSSQIVYKSAYKDISEFDALFFTEDSLFFVEMSTSKKTASLNKRLAKKYALLKLIFPYLEIKALIVLTKGSVGVRNFPSYATVWITEDLENEELINSIIFAKKMKNNMQTLSTPTSSKFIEAYSIKYKKFPYFPTLEWILNTSRKHPKFAVDLRFFSLNKMELYFDVYTKLYIGFLSSDDFKELFSDFSYLTKEEKVIVTLEKVTQTQIDIVYYAKETNEKLQRIRLCEDGEISIKEKEPDGFTNAEVRFFYKVFEDKHRLSVENIRHILKNLNIVEFKK